MDSESPVNGTAWPDYDKPGDATSNVQVNVTGLYPAYRTCPVCRGVFPDDDAWHEVILDGRVVKICARCYDRLTMLIEG